MSEKGDTRVENEPQTTKYYIWTDADGTLLDHHTYSPGAASEALALAAERKAPVHIISSKTAAELIELQKEIGIHGQAPFTAENGGASYYPQAFFNFDIASAVPEYTVEELNGFSVIRFGKPYSEVRAALHEAAVETKLSITGIGDMSTQEFASYTGLSLEKAAHGQQRQFQEGFIINISDEEQKAAQARIKEALLAKGMEFSFGGRFCQVFSGGSKEKAVDVGTRLYRRNYPGERIITIGIGDAPNDLGFLERCDLGYLVGNPNKIKGADVESARIHRVPEVGPTGWNRIVLSVLRGQADTLTQPA